MKAALTAILVLLLAGCAAHRPPKRVPAEFANKYGCDPVGLWVRADNLRAELGFQRVYVPEVGWSACDVIAHNGLPSRIDSTSAESRDGERWFYLGNAVEKTLPRVGSGAWVVTVQPSDSLEAWMVTVVHH